MNKEDAYEFLVATYSGYGVLQMLVHEFGIRQVREMVSEIAAQQSVQRTAEWSCQDCHDHNPDDKEWCGRCGQPRRR